MDVELPERPDLGLVVEAVAPGRLRHRRPCCSRSQKVSRPQVHLHRARVWTKAVALVIMTAAAVLLLSCSSERSVPDGPAATVTSTTFDLPRTTAPVEPEAETGSTRVIVDDVSLDAGQHLAIAFHPDSSPARVWSSSSTLDVCPAGLDGTVEGSSWPPWTPFESCEQLGVDGLLLPAADGSSHLAFAFRANEDVDRTRLIVDYTRTDGFFAVLPPIGSATDLEVTFTPGSSTIAVVALDLPNQSPSQTAQTEIRQGEATIDAAATCDFLGAAHATGQDEDCLGPVTARAPVTVQLHAPGTGDLQVMLSLSWA